MGLAATNFGEAWRLAEGKELGDKIMSMMGTVPVAFANPLPSLHPLDLLVGLCCGAGLRLAVYLRGKNAKKYRHGVEYGSARWGTPKDIEPFMAPKFADNIILTKTERLMMSNRPPDPKNARNKNVLVVGGSGSGKTRFWLKPNLLQCHSSYVVTDPKGSIVVECGNALLKNGYKLKILNTINFSKSMHYNPFAYVHSEKDILKLVTTLMTNTKGEGSGGDPFWEKSERLLLTALIAYLHYEAPAEEQNFATLLEMLNTMQVLEDDEEYQNPVDLLFEELAKKKPNSFAGRQYKLYKLAAGKTAKSILISCGARLAPFDIQELRDLTMYDELQLDTLGDKKTALFLIMSDTDSTFNFLISMVYTQLFNLLCDKADDVYGGKLPIHVRCLIDECANIGQIPNLEKLVATIRSREISACLVLQAKSQLKEGFLQKLEQRGYEIKRGKYTSVKGTRQKRFIRFRTLGAGYSEDEIKAVIAGDAEHCPHQKQPPKEQPFHLLVDIQAKLSEGKSEGYARWAKKYNLKEMSKTLIFLQEKKIGSIKEMQERVDAATARYHELGDSIKAAETRMAEIAVLRTHIVNYAKTRPVYDAYRKAGYSKRFLENHRAEITLHKAAKAAFDESNLKTLPKVKELDAEYSKLLTEKKAAYPDYRKAKDEMQELLRAQRNVDLFFAEEKNPTEKAQSR